jgi:glycosyltransferase involved in cell wall biosynthesis
MKTALIITTYNWKEALSKSLHSVLAFSHMPDVIVVADDGSSDGTGAMVKQFASDFSLPLLHSWQPDEGFRLSHSRNRAIMKADADYVIVVDGDVLMHPNFIADHLYFAQPKRFIDGSRVLLGEKISRKILAGAGPSITIFSPNIWNRKNTVNSRLLASIFSKEKHHIRGIRGCNMSFFMSDFIAVNGFNEDIHGWGREDSEFLIRLQNRGVVRFSLKFSANVNHIFHPENDRSSLSANDQILDLAINEKWDWCFNGCDKYS